MLTFRPPPDWPKIVTLPEPPDVVADPFKRGDDIEVPCIASLRILLSTQVREIEVAECVEPMVDADDNDVVRLREIRAVVDVETGRPGIQAATMQPDHDGSLCIRGRSARRIDSQREAILAHGFPAVHGGHFRRFATGKLLGRTLAELGGLAYSCPRSGPGGRHEAPCTGSRTAIRDATEREDAIIDRSLDTTIGGFDFSAACSVDCRGTRRTFA
jgi:hypothetical protein